MDLSAVANAHTRGDVCVFIDIGGIRDVSAAVRMLVAGRVSVTIKIRGGGMIGKQKKKQSGPECQFRG